MTYDTLVDEVRAVREAYAKRLDYDPQAIFEDIKEQEKKSGRELVSAPPRRMGTAEPARAPSSP
jgi:hypothetical protein